MDGYQCGGNPFDRRSTVAELRRGLPTLERTVTVRGDWAKITARGSAVIYGRSDSTLNRQGIRMGSSEIYSAVEDLAEAADSLVVGLELPEGGYYMPLFVVLGEGLVLDDLLKARIRDAIRTNLTPCHVPGGIYQITDVPRTLNGKKLAVPVKEILTGVSVETAVNLDSIRNPAALTRFAGPARELISIREGKS